MVLSFLDWLIVAAVFLLSLSSVLFSRSHMRSVADFLSANRTAGRYLITVSGGVAALGAITVMGTLEMNLQAGFCLNWWGMTMSVVILAATASGWVIYRFRQTRCLTLAQFFELRYSRRFRVFTGLLAFLAGIVNMGIFPAVEARFFLHFCGLPATLALGPVAVSTFALLMALLIGTSLFFVFAGGQVAVIATDFLQGAFVNAGLLAITLWFALTTDWGAIAAALAQAPPDASLVNPLRTSQVRDFNFWYFLIGVFGYLYGTMSWQGTQAYNSSAENAHEARMAGLLGNWRLLPQNIMLGFVPIVAYTALHHPAYAGVIAAIRPVLDGAETEAVRSQLTTPLVMQQLLPHGLLGVFAALMLAASLTTLSSYMHSWGSILVQDVIVPLRRRPLAPRAHLAALRGAVLCVALFIFAFSLLFRQTQYIFLFFAVTGAIFAGGSGAVIIGGLYWRRGSAAAAWAAMITGSAIAVGGVVVHQIEPGFFLNGQEFWALAMAASSLAFVAVSLLGPRRACDLDALLHRHPGERGPRRRWRLPGFGPDFTRLDKALVVANYVWALGWFAVFVAGTAWGLAHEIPDATWLRFWQVHLAIHLTLGCATVVWFTAGGFGDLRRMFGRLRVMARDERDDGFVRAGEAPGRPDAGGDA